MVRAKINSIGSKIALTPIEVMPYNDSEDTDEEDDGVDTEEVD